MYIFFQNPGTFLTPVCGAAVGLWGPWRRFSAVFLMNTKQVAKKYYNFPCFSLIFNGKSRFSLVSIDPH